MIIKRFIFDIRKISLIFIILSQIVSFFQLKIYLTFKDYQIINYFIALKFIKMLVYVLLTTLIALLKSALPIWSTYPANVMYSGQYSAFTTLKNANSVYSATQTIYRSDITPSNYFTQTPTIVMSLLGYKQSAPSSSSSSVGFDISIASISRTSFNVVHNIIGASMLYLQYMYLAYYTTDYHSGFYTQVFDQTVTNKTYQFLINHNDPYNNSSHLIEMKGFLCGYKMQQGTANGVFLNFALTYQDFTHFKIQVSINNNAIIQQIWYYRIGYDRTAIERSTYNHIFRDFSFQLINNTNTKTVYNAAWASNTQFQYRNFLMGTNKINIIGAIPMAVQFYLYYYFARSLTSVDATYYTANPAVASYLSGQSFYHVISSCTNGISSPYYLPSDRNCYATCPSSLYFQDPTSKTCIPCDYTCLTCSSGHDKSTCLTCNTNYRQLVNTSQCGCADGRFDDGVNLVCSLCYSTCLTCTRAGAAACKTCNSTLNRLLTNTDINGLGNCACQPTYYQNINAVCTICSFGCLVCSLSGTNVLCSSCNTNSNFQLISNACQCVTGYQLNLTTCVPITCGDGIVSPTEQCDDNNLINGDGCTNLCKVQANHKCFINVTILPYSICYYSAAILMQITNIQKSPYANQVNLKIQINADGINDKFLNNYLTSEPSLTLEDAGRRLLFFRLLASVKLSIKSISFDSITKKLSLSFSYNQSFDLSSKKIVFKPSVSIGNADSKYFYNSPSAIVNLQPSYNKIDTIFHPSSDYSISSQIKYSFMILIILFWFGTGLLIVWQKGNVAMEMFIVVQIAWVGVNAMAKVDIMMAGLVQFGAYSLGYNLNMLTTNSCNTYNAIGLDCMLANNINISFLLMIIALLTYFTLRLINRYLNNKAEKSFIARKQRKMNQPNNIRTQQYLKQANESSQQQSQTSQAIQFKYYKQQQFIPKRVLNILLDFMYFMVFMTTMVWIFGVFSFQLSAINLLICILMPIYFVGMWLFWFFTYKTYDFSFINAHKQSKDIYKVDDSISQQQNNQNQTQKNGQNKVQRSEQNQVTQNKKNEGQRPICGFKIARVILYPLVWLLIVILSIVLSSASKVEYLSQSLIIFGCFVCIILISVQKQYKQRLDHYRCFLNLTILITIQILYIISQSNLLTGLSLSISILCLLGFLFITNVGSIAYLVWVQWVLNTKIREKEELKRIDEKIRRLEEKRRDIEIQDLGLFFRKQQSSIKYLEATNNNNRFQTTNNNKRYQTTNKKHLQASPNKNFFQASPNKNYLQGSTKKMFVQNEQDIVNIKQQNQDRLSNVLSKNFFHSQSINQLIQKQNALKHADNNLSQSLSKIKKGKIVFGDQE